MNCLDFFGTSPTLSIFQTEANKTNFGGVLFIIYIIIMLFISLAYIIDYASNEKYEIESSTVMYSKASKDKFPDPEIDIKIRLYSYKNLDMTDKLFVCDENDILYKGKFYAGHKNYYGEIIYETIYDLKKSVSNLDLRIISLCQNNCLEINFSDIYFNITFSTKSYILDNYDSIPLQIAEEDFDDNLIYIDLKNNQTFSAKMEWTSIVYKEKQGISRIFNDILNINNTYTWGFIDLSYEDVFYYDEYFKYFFKRDEEGNLIRQIICGRFLFKRNKYFDYKRKKIEFTDIIAKIGSLFSTFNFIFSFIYKYYSINFNNYKIIEKVLDYNTNNINKRQISINNDIKNIKDKEIELKNISKENSGLINDSLEKNNEIKLNKEENITEELLKDNEQNIESNDKDEEIKFAENKIKLPKLSFFDFYLENIYCKICKKNQKEEILKACNKIILKYTSIDFMLINFIKVENLFKDYKWNNPKLIELNNSELLKNLFELLKA